MSIGRYTFANRFNAGEGISNPRSSSKIFRAVESGQISVTYTRLGGAQRLDAIAYEKYGDGSYWWVIAAASGIGYCLQASAGAYLRIPNNLSDALRFVV